MSEQSTPIQPGKSGAAKLLGILAGLGVVLSVVLLYHHVQVTSGLENKPSFCSFSEHFDCDRLARSQYSTIFGIPTASFALLYYLTLLGLVIFPGTSGNADAREEASAVAGTIAFMTLLGLFGTLAMMFISLVVVQTVCIMCAGLYVIGLLAFFAGILHARRFGPYGSSLSNGARTVAVLLTSLLGRGRTGERSRLAAAAIFFCSFGDILFPQPPLATDIPAARCG